jgi:hypothetical protein
MEILAYAQSNVKYLEARMSRNKAYAKHSYVRIAGSKVGRFVGTRDKIALMLH